MLFKNLMGLRKLGCKIPNGSTQGCSWSHMKMKGDKCRQPFSHFLPPYPHSSFVFFCLYKWFLCTFSTCIFIFPLLLFVLCAHPLFKILLIFNTSSFSFICVCICFFCVLCTWPLFIFPFFVAIVGDFFLLYTLCIFVQFRVFFVLLPLLFLPLIVLFFALCVSSFCYALACQSHQLSTSHQMSFIIWTLLKVLCKIDSI